MLWIIDEMRLTENLSNVAKTFKKAFHGRHDFLLEVQMLWMRQALTCRANQRFL